MNAPRFEPRVLPTSGASRTSPLEGRSDDAGEHRAVHALVRQLACASDDFAQHMVTNVLSLCGAQSAGFAAQPPEADARWIATAGAWPHGAISAVIAARVMAAAPADGALLLEDPTHAFPALADTVPEIGQLLLMPCRGADGDVLGSLWASAPASHHRFSSEDAERLAMLAGLAAVHLQRRRKAASTRSQPWRSPPDVGDDDAALESEIDDLERLQVISTRLIDAEGTQPLLDEIIEAAIAVTGADMGNIQLLDTARGVLTLSAQRGFEAPFLQHFAVVATGSQSCCGRALREGRRMVVADVASDPIYSDASRQAMLGAGALAVQSTPLVTRDGKPLGMLSTHWRRRFQPTARQLHLLDLLARQASDLLDRARTTESLQATTERLRLADRRKDAFLATLGHELRNPLAALDLATRLLAHPGSDREDVDRVLQTNVRKLTELVNDMLEVSRITRGKIELRRRHVDLVATACDAIDGVRDAIDRKQQELVVIAGSPVIVDADPTRIGQVVGNLLANANTYSPEGSRLELEVTCDGTTAVVRVTDEGCGIEPDVLAQMFEPFTQGTPGGGGLGIGLWLARVLVELHGGSLTGHSAGRGHGCRFEVRLPLVAAPPTEDVEAIRTQPRLEGLSVLVVDDHADSAELLTMLLRARGCTVDAVHRGGAAVERARDGDYDVVLSDLGLTDLDGWEVARRIRAHDRDVVLIALTGFGDEDTAQRVAASAFTTRMVKPIDPDALLEVLARVRAGGTAG